MSMETEFSIKLLTQRAHDLKLEKRYATLPSYTLGTNLWNLLPRR